MNNENAAGILILLLFLLSIHTLKTACCVTRPAITPFKGQIFVQISGKVKHPGVYAFCRPPDLPTAIDRSGGLIADKECGSGKLYSGSRIDVRDKTGSPDFLKSEMSAFYKITLGIPISLNRATVSGLTAIPGIGTKTAFAIIYERNKKMGFGRLEELMDVKGIGPSLYKKIRQYLVLKQVKG